MPAQPLCGCHFPGELGSRHFDGGQQLEGLLLALQLQGAMLGERETAMVSTVLLIS